MLRFLASLFGWRKESAKIVVVGLNHSGKTTILKRLAGEESRFRSLWESKYDEVDGVIFVVDAADKMRVAVARDELEQLERAMGKGKGKGREAPLLFMANKQDLPSALSAAELMESLKMADSAGPWHVQGTCALTGDGLREAVQWLAQAIRKRREEEKA